MIAILRNQEIQDTILRAVGLYTLAVLACLFFWYVENVLNVELE